MKKLLPIMFLLIGLLLFVPSIQLAQAQESTATPTATATATITPSMSPTPAIWFRGATSANQGYQVKYVIDLGDIMLFVAQLVVVTLVVALMLIDQAKRSS
jgi:hypothetical protein